MTTFPNYKVLYINVNTVLMFMIHIYRSYRLKLMKKKQNYKFSINISNSYKSKLKANDRNCRINSRINNVTTPSVIKKSPILMKKKK